MSPVAPRREKRIWRWLLAGGGLLAAMAALGYFAGPVALGAWQARQDMSAGQARYLLYGELAPHEDDVAALLQQRHGIRVERVAGCVVTDILVRQWRAYNRRVSERAGFHGERDVFLATVDELMAKDRAAGGAR